MKKLVFTLLIILATSVSAHAVSTVVLFNNLSTTGNSSAYRVPVGLKSVLAKGYTNAKVEQALGGTFALSCAPSSDGPWVACKDDGANAISVSNADGVFNMNNSFLWVRATWTRTSGNIKAWLLTQ